MKGSASDQGAFKNLFAMDEPLIMDDSYYLWHNGDVGVSMAVELGRCNY